MPGRARPGRPALERVCGANGRHRRAARAPPGRGTRRRPRRSGASTAASSRPSCSAPSCSPTSRSRATPVVTQEVLEVLADVDRTRSPSLEAEARELPDDLHRPLPIGLARAGRRRGARDCTSTTDEAPLLRPRHRGSGPAGMHSDTEPGGSDRERDQCTAPRPSRDPCSIAGRGDGRQRRQPVVFPTTAARSAVSGSRTTRSSSARSRPQRPPRSRDGCAAALPARRDPQAAAAASSPSADRNWPAR